MVRHVVDVRALGPSEESGIPARSDVKTLRRLFVATPHRILLSVLLVFAWSPRAMAWGPTGHLVIAQIAYDELSPAARAEADRLIAVLAGFEPVADHFVPAAYWLDQIKARGWTSFDTWHYTNQPLLAGSSKAPPPPPFGLDWALEQAQRTVGNPTAPELARAFMLRALIHLVGDAHQPLHCVSRYSAARPEGDRGGNDFVLPDPELHNLHRLWDATGGALPADVLGTDWAAAVAPLAHKVRAAHPRDKLPEVGGLEVAGWLDESYALAVTVAYAGIEEGAAPTLEYLERVQAVALERLALAGYRLADLLERLLQPPAPHLPAATADEP